MSEPQLTIHGEILVPYALMTHRQPPEVERLLHNYGLLPVLAEDRRWQMAADRHGYVLTYTFVLASTP